MQTKSIKPLRLSASLILSLGDSAEDKNKFLMLIRKPHMSFENSLVFPGGVCDAEDEKMSASFAQFSKITAIRQTLEETGILLLPPNSSVNNIEVLKLHYAERKFNELNKLILSQWQNHTNFIIPIVRFITPQFPKMSRFDCYFFRLSEGVQRINLGKSSSLLALSIHAEESSKFYWAKPEQYLKMLQNGTVHFPPPQRIILNYLAKEPKVSLLHSIQPLIGQIRDNQFLLPGDKNYNYSQFEELEPNSRTKQQICSYVAHKKQLRKQNSLRRIDGLFPSARPGNQFKVNNTEFEKEETILALLISQNITPRL